MPADGRKDRTVDGKTTVLVQSFIVPSNALHGCRALAAGRLIDSFTPARLEFLPEQTG